MMTMTMIADYGSQYASSTLSSETLSGSCGSRKNRIRTIRLIRPSHSSLPPPNLTCRHGPSLGFSLRGGREHGTGFFVSHVEPDSEAQRQGLKVGDQIIRVNGFTVDDAVHKEVLQLISNHTQVTLKVRSVGMIPVKEKKSACLSWQIITDDLSLRFSPPPNEKKKDVRVNIMVAPRSKLGCGICKGPDWKPGIFVQFTKEGGIARDAGLRPGDQILFCNNVNFTDVSFNEAVNLMKTSRQLELIVRKSAGSDLFPTESSGYNSSASSVTGDQSPSWSESKRLSIVREESLDLDDRIERFKLNKWQKENDWENDEKQHQYFKPTIINLSENGTTIKNNGSEEECREQTSHCNETKTVVVEVHRSDNTHHQQIKTEENNIALMKSSSNNSLISRSNSGTTSSSLSSAISQEIQRRSEKKQNENKPSIDEQLQKKKILKGVTSEKQHQHNRLMDEFKQAHKKMFKMTDKHPSDISKIEDDRSTSLKLSQKLSERLSNLPFNGDSETTSTMPPPPPPPPVEKSTTIVRSNNKKGKAPPVPPVKTSTLSYYHQLPPCPTPDYDTLSLLSIQSLPKKELATNKQSQILRNIEDVQVEMESLDSNKINGGGEGDIKPKPPDIYFESPVVTKKDQPRPVSVTIGEYPSSAATRKNPGRLDFLHNEQNSCSDFPMSNQFASELAQTLGRSNLKTRTESMERLLNSRQMINSQNDKGSLRILLNNNNISKNLTKSVDDLAALGSYANCVTINFNSIEKKIDMPSGILKNGTHKTLAQQKSITFGETATVISDRILQVN